MSSTFKPEIIKGTCDYCGRQGDVFLAWDKRRYLCKNANRCLGRGNQQNQERTTT